MYIIGVTNAVTPMEYIMYSAVGAVWRPLPGNGKFVPLPFAAPILFEESKGDRRKQD